MKCLIISDLHGNNEEEIIDRKHFRAVDCILLGGDITSKKGTRISFYFSKPTLGVHGNHEVWDQVFPTPMGFINLHMRTVQFRSYQMGGIGGLITPSPTRIYHISEIQAKKYLEQLRSIDLLLLHEPLFGYFDFNRTHFGSKMLLEMVKRVKPRNVITGHSHNLPGYQKLGQTQIISPGVARDGFYSILDLSSNKIEFYENGKVIHP